MALINVPRMPQAVPWTAAKTAVSKRESAWANKISAAACIHMHRTMISRLSMRSPTQPPHNWPPMTKISSKVTLAAAASCERPTCSTMCGIWCTSTVPTTKSAELWPVDRSQKAGVRNAWRAVKRGSSPGSSVAVSGLTASPSGRRP